MGVKKDRNRTQQCTYVGWFSEKNKVLSPKANMKLNFDETKLYFRNYKL